MSHKKDIYIPKLDTTSGSYHPINFTIDIIIEILANYGFDYTEGPEIESEEFNFDKRSNLSSGTSTVAIFGSIVQNG